MGGVENMTLKKQFREYQIYFFILSISGGILSVIRIIAYKDYSLLAIVLILLSIMALINMRVLNSFLIENKESIESTITKMTIGKQERYILRGELRIPFKSVYTNKNKLLKDLKNQGVGLPKIKEVRI